MIKPKRRGRWDLQLWNSKRWSCERQASRKPALELLRGEWAHLCTLFQAEFKWRSRSTLNGPGIYFLLIKVPDDTFSTCIFPVQTKWKTISDDKECVNFELLLCTKSCSSYSVWHGVSYAQVILRGMISLCGLSTGNSCYFVVMYRASCCTSRFFTWMTDFQLGIIFVAKQAIWVSVLCVCFDFLACCWVHLAILLVTNLIKCANLSGSIITCCLCLTKWVQVPPLIIKTFLGLNVLYSICIYA